MPMQQLTQDQIMLGILPAVIASPGYLVNDNDSIKKAIERAYEIADLINLRKGEIAMAQGKLF